MKNMDSWYKTFVLIICDLYWFNPVFLLMKQMAYKDVEYVCDEIVTKSMESEEKQMEIIMLVASIWELLLNQ